MSPLDLLGISSSNHPCSDAERKELSFLLAQLQDLRDQHIQMLADTTDTINRCQFALAPHRRVPPEILREIFIWCSYDVDDGLNFAEFEQDYLKLPSSELPQLAVSRVCSDWRTIALSTPQLWNRVHIEHLDPISVEHANRWLLRAGNLPVFIRIMDIDSVDSVWTCRGVNSFLSHFRLKGLEFPLYSKGPFPGDLAEASYKDLEELSIWGSSGTPKTLSLETARYPSLIRLYLDAPISNIQPSATLRNLEIRSTISIPQFWDLLRGFPLLEEALFSNVSINQTSTPKDVHNPSLKDLRASFMCRVQVDFGYIIDPLTLPQLAKLTILLSGQAQWSPKAYSRMAQRSNFSPHLNSFRLRIDGNGKIDIDSLLTCTPYLKEICIGAKFAWGVGTIAGLGSGRICPNMENMALSYVPDVVEFLEMVKVRQENAQLRSNGGGDGCRVKAFNTLRFGTGAPPGLDLLLQSLKESGVQVFWRQDVINPI